MKTYHFVMACTLVIGFLCACGNSDNYPDFMGRQIVIQADGLIKDTLYTESEHEVQLSAHIEPFYTEEGNITWSADDENIATVSDKGVVTGHENGCTIIRALEKAPGYKDIYGIGSIVVKVYGETMDVYDEEIPQNLAQSPKR